MAILEPTNLLLLACALIYGLIGEPQEAWILLAFVGAISLLDGWQQRRSQRALAELARLSSPRARVIRGGRTLELAPEQVQVGDRLRLDEGDRVAADAHLLEGVGLWLDASLLTGESLPVEGNQSGQLIRAGSLVASGRGLAEVVAVGEATELGRLRRSLVSVTPPPTRLQRHTRRLTSRLTVVSLVLCASLAVLQGSLSGAWSTALLAALALALAVLPNEIPVVLTLFLALGSLRLARIGVLARWPAAVESLGSATVLAVDKTGTLTENRMAVQQLLTWPQAALWQAGEPLAESWHRLLELALLASRHDPVDAMEQAIARLAQAELHHSEHLHPDWPLLREYPLSPELLVFSQLWCDADGQWQIAAKGAPEAIAQLCHLPPERSAVLLQAAEALAAQGLRVLAVASGLEGAPRHPRSGSAWHQGHGGALAGIPLQALPTGQTRPGDPATLALDLDGGPAMPSLPADSVHDYLFEPIGLLGLADPLRPDVPEAVALARGAGIRVVMITGDAPRTARAIADQAGLPAGPVLCGAELLKLEAPATATGDRDAANACRAEGPATGLPSHQAEQLNSGAAARLAAEVASVSVFARVLPQQKLQIVRALQAAGEVVAMTGDGVNDAPALRAADIGVAMGKRGTAVARESADLVLLNDNFGSLVQAIALGRRIEVNLRRALGYTLAIHLPIAVLSLLPFLVPHQPLLLLPVHIALLHLVIDPACTVVFEALPAHPGLMQQPPRSPEAPLFGAAVWRRALLQGGMLSLAVLAAALWPDVTVEDRRSLVVAMLLLAGGVLVWMNGEPRQPVTAWAAAIGLGLWVLLQAIPGLNALLLLRPLPPRITAVLLSALALLMLLHRGDGASPQPGARGTSALPPRAP